MKKSKADYTFQPNHIEYDLQSNNFYIKSAQQLITSSVSV